MGWLTNNKRLASVASLSGSRAGEVASRLAGRTQEAPFPLPQRVKPEKKTKFERRQSGTFQFFFQLTPLSFTPRPLFSTPVTIWLLHRTVTRSVCNRPSHSPHPRLGRWTNTPKGVGRSLTTEHRVIYPHHQTGSDNILRGTNWF